MNRDIKAVLSTLLLLAAMTASGQPLHPEVGSDIDLMSLQAGQAVEARLSRQTGLIRFLSTTGSTPIPVQTDGSAEQRARDFLQDFGRAFGATDIRELQTRRVSPVDEVGMEHVRFQQTYNGIPVTGGEITVHLRGPGVVASNAHLLSDLSGVASTPTIDTTQASQLALDMLTKRGMGANEISLLAPRLEIFNRGMLEGASHPTRLAWFVEARGPKLREFIWLDATEGHVLLNFSQLTDARARAVYDMDNTIATLPGPSLTRGEGDPVSGITDVDLAYDYSGDTYDYFFNVHGRDSYDDAGAPLISTVRYCRTGASCPYANAFWNGSQMVYGDGFAAADDVAAHELTHAVTDYTANLFYYMQSGALNESFSDIFGETVDLVNGAGTDTAGVRWELGEDIPGIGAIRNMLDPTLHGDPGKLSDGQFVCATPGGDGGGVHSNSGVPNHAYALMVDGGSYNGYSVSGIGLTKAGKIQYRSLSQYLLSASDFLDNYDALNQSCSDLIGTAGITAADCTQVKQALDAVEMSDPWPCGPALTTVPLCGTGETVSIIHSDDFEGAINWNNATLVGSNAWFLQTYFVTSGTTGLRGVNHASVSDSSTYMANDVALPAGASYLHFKHSYGFEDSNSATFWDGGVIEYSTDGGSTWTDAGSLIVAGSSYGGVIESGYSNPLSGRNAFVADSYGYTETKLDLTGLAGQNFRLRFRIGADSIANDYGWYIDDINIYQCTGCISDLLLSSGTDRNVQTYQACGTITAGSSYKVGATGVVTLHAPTVELTAGIVVGRGGILSVERP